MQLYEIIYSDPPWSYRGRKQFGFAGDVGIDSGGAVMHYETLQVKEICKLNVKNISAENCLLFIWVPNPLLPDGLEVIQAWGFKYATIAFIWYKQRTNPGYYTMSECEVCYVAKKGKIPFPRGSRNERQFIEQLRGKHSAKPAEVRNRINKMFPSQKKIELFARERVEGWDAWGNEI